MRDSFVECKPGHDFFEPQPIKNADAFILKQICHDWPDEYAAKILRHLRDASTPSTVLVMIDCIVPYACEVRDTSLTTTGLTFSRTPPLLPDYVDADPSIYYTDLSVRTFHILCNISQANLPLRCMFTSAPKKGLSGRLFHC